jgi:predicted DNA-binding transcriptional regulator AlpA
MSTATTPMVMTKPLTLNEVAARAGLCRQTLMKRVKAGRFPPPLGWGVRIWLWDPDVVEAFLAGRRARGKVT